MKAKQKESKKPIMVKVYISNWMLNQLEQNTRGGNTLTVNEYYRGLQVIINNYLDRGLFYTEDVDGNIYIMGDPKRKVEISLEYLKPVSPNWHRFSYMHEMNARIVRESFPVFTA